MTRRPFPVATHWRNGAPIKDWCALESAAGHLTPDSPPAADSSAPSVVPEATALEGRLPVTAAQRPGDARRPTVLGALDCQLELQECA